MFCKIVCKLLTFCEPCDILLGNTFKWHTLVKMFDYMTSAVQLLYISVSDPAFQRMQVLVAN